MADEGDYAPLTAAEIEGLRAYLPGGRGNWGVGAIGRLLATLDAYREIARAVAKGAVASDALGYYRACLYCTWAANDYDSEPEHDRGCPVTRARALLGENT